MFSFLFVFVLLLLSSAEKKINYVFVIYFIWKTDMAVYLFW